MTTDSSFRAELYDSYVSGHQGRITESGSRASLESDVIPHLPADRHSRVVDIGCGQGQLVGLLQEHGYDSVIGIDVSAEQVDLAHNLGRPTVQRAELFSFVDAHGSEFDAVTAIDVVEHFERDHVIAVFEALTRLLRADGTLILRTPNAASPYGGRILYSDLTHGVAYTKRSLEQVCAAVGLEFVGAFPVRPAGKRFRQRVRRTMWRGIEAGFIAPLIVETGHVRGHLVTQNLIGVARRHQPLAT